MPSAVEALLFLAGAVAGFAIVGATAHGNPRDVLRTPQATSVRLWAGFHLPSVGLAIGAAALIVQVVRSPLAWPIVGLCVTVIFLAVTAAQFTFAEVHQR